MGLLGKLFPGSGLIIKIATYTVIVVVGYIILASFFPDLNVFKRKEFNLKNTAVIIEESKNIAELFSATYYAEVVVDTTKVLIEEKVDVMSSLINLEEVDYNDSSIHEFVLIGHGHSYAGNNLQSLKKEDITIQDSLCIIKLPTATVFNTVINPSDFDIFIDEGNWSPEEVQTLKQLAVEKIKAQAINDGLLEKANKRTLKLMTDFIKSIGFKKVKVEFI